MNEIDLHYPPDTCPFCNIAAAYPFPVSPLWNDSKEELGKSVPSDEEAGHEKTDPSSFVVLRSRDVVAFLDILPMTGGELWNLVRQKSSARRMYLTYNISSAAPYIQFLRAKYLGFGNY